jgi:hypothetical protein
VLQPPPDSRSATTRVTGTAAWGVMLIKPLARQLVAVGQLIEARLEPTSPATWRLRRTRVQRPARSLSTTDPLFPAPTAVHARAEAHETERSVPVASGDETDDQCRPSHRTNSGLMATWGLVVTPCTCPTAMHIPVDGHDSPVSSYWLCFSDRPSPAGRLVADQRPVLQRNPSKP